MYNFDAKISSRIVFVLVFTVEKFSGAGELNNKKDPIVAALHRSMGDMLRSLTRKRKATS